MGYDTDTGDSLGKRLLNTTDAQVWAKAFKDQFGDVAPDEATMLTWFGNAIETGRSFGGKETCSHERCTGLANDLWVCDRCGTVSNVWPIPDGQMVEEPTLEEHFREGFNEARD
jgi:hypothetical protein